MPVKRRTLSERADALEQLEAWRAVVREGAPCPVCHALRNQRCFGKQNQPVKRNHAERERLFRRWCDEQAEAEQLDRMMGRARRG